MPLERRVLIVGLGNEYVVEHELVATNFGRPYGQFLQRHFDYFYAQAEELTMLRKEVETLNELIKNAT